MHLGGGVGTAHCAREEKKEGEYDSLLGTAVPPIGWDAIGVMVGNFALDQSPLAWLVDVRGRTALAPRDHDDVGGQGGVLGVCVELDRRSCGASTSAVEEHMCREKRHGARRITFGDVDVQKEVESGDILGAFPGVADWAETARQHPLSCIVINMQEVGAHKLAEGETRVLGSGRGERGGFGAVGGTSRVY